MDYSGSELPACSFFDNVKTLPGEWPTRDERLVGSGCLERLKALKNSRTSTRTRAPAGGGGGAASPPSSTPEPETARSALTNTPQLHATPRRDGWKMLEWSNRDPERELRSFYSRKGLSPAGLADLPKLERFTAPSPEVDELVRISLEMRFSSVRVRAESQAARARRQYRRAAPPLAAPNSGKVRCFSPKSRLRCQAAAAELDATGVQSDIMLTLTYPGRWREVCSSGEHVKRHMRVYRERLTRYMRSQLCNFSALWFLEFQGRGAPHLHLILFGPGLQRLDIKDFRAWSRRAWAEVVVHPHPGDAAKHRKHGSHASMMRKRHFGYAAKYASKASQKDVPDGFTDVGRFWGLWNYKPPPPYCAVLEVPTKHLKGLCMALVMAIKDKSIPYANKILARFEVHEQRECRNLSASAVVFGSDAFRRVCNWIDVCRSDNSNYLLSG